ncbi:hypothetical protein [Vibrio alginolyticus]|uniref:hypothetical protein n=1 Tax=Vibrio alginolyticus TaxID=663 RepID=UPI001BD67FB4|nr:hypothetical protein [Vibrio alginolyticus]MBS9903567.1 hypothetical protein [Vibrio alginolyticus]
MGVESDRFRTWYIGFLDLITNPYGGRNVQLNNLNTGYIHNSFLDISFISGFLPLVYLLTFYFLHLKFVVNLLCGRKIILFAFGFSSFLCLFYEPVLQGSPVFFSFHIMLLGFLINTNRRGEVSGK